MSRLLSTLLAASAAALVLGGAPTAFALFNAKATGGPLTIASATVAAPKTVKAAQTKCKTNRSPEVLVEWSATTSEVATEYAVERASTSNGPYTEVASVPISQRSYTDSASLGYSTTYYYRVSATVESWSAPSSAVSVKTLGKSCS